MELFVEPSRYAFSWFAVPVVVTGAVSVALALVTVRRERSSSVSLAFAGMSLAVAVWLVGVAGVYTARDAALALAWTRIAHVGVCLIPASVFLFAGAVTDRVRATRWMVAAGYVAAALLYAVDASTTWIVSGVQRYYFGYYAIFSLTLSPLLLAYFAVFLGGSLYLLRAAIARTRSSAQRGRLRALLVALAIAELAIVDFLPAFHVAIYPFGFVFIGAFLAIGAWAIMRYRLVDITPALAATEIIGAMADGLLVVDRDGVVRVANAAASGLWGLSTSAVGLSIEALDARWSQPALARLVDPSRERHAEVAHGDPGGTPRMALVSSSALADHRSVWVGTVFMIRDITERWRAERTLRASEERFRSLVQHATDLITVIDPDTTVRYQSPAIERVLGLPPAEVIGTRLRDALHHDDRARIVAAFARLIEQPGAVVTGEGRVRHANGEWRHLEFTGTDQRGNAAIGGLVLNAHDVTERKRLEDELRLQARQDALTGLPNRASFTEHLEQALSRRGGVGADVAVLYLDVDGFKAINDRLGHTAGDHLLRDVGCRLESAVRAGDLVARIGGDEFAVVLAEVASADEAAASAGRILSALAEPFAIEGAGASISASIGVALPGPGETTADRLLRNADVAMYAAKSRGRSRYELYDERRREATIRRATSGTAHSPLGDPADGEADRLRRDVLTGAWNHAAIVDLVKHEIERGVTRPVSVAIVDVNGMTDLNDTFGHDAGDVVLREVAQLLAEHGATVGRYGGDRFLALLPDTHRVAAQAFVADVTGAVDGLRVRDAETLSAIPVTISAGLATYPDEAGGADGVIRLAEGAMFAAKARRSSAQGDATRRIAERVTSLSDELTPLLTSPASLDEKIRMVAGRLSDGLGYDAAECTLFGPAGGEMGASCALVEGQVTPLVQRWADDQARDPRRGETPIRVLMANTRRPILIDDLATDDRIAEHRRQMMAELGLHSALIVPMTSEGEVIGELGLARRVRAGFGPADARFLTAVAHQVAAMVRMATLVDGLQVASRQLESAQAETVFMLAAAAEAHDRTTGQHLRHLRGLSEALARELGYDDAAVREVGLAAMLHDIGKISVPDAVLASPLRFDTDDAELGRFWDTLKRHSVWGAEFLGGRPGFELAARVARWHHERWDGGGYPDGLAGADLPEEVTIVTVADAFDAMVSDRPYRSGRPPGAAAEEIVACSGRQFNPRVVDALVRLYESGRLPAHTDQLERAA